MICVIPVCRSRDDVRREQRFVDAALGLPTLVAIEQRRNTST